MYLQLCQAQLCSAVFLSLHAHSMLRQGSKELDRSSSPERSSPVILSKAKDQRREASHGQTLRCAHGDISGKGDCYDNAMMESFFSSLKTECVYQQVYQSRSEAKQSIFEWILVFYNRQRRHSSLAYLSPVAYELQGSHV